MLRQISRVLLCSWKNPAGFPSRSLTTKKWVRLRQRFSLKIPSGWSEQKFHLISATLWFFGLVVTPKWFSDLFIPKRDMPSNIFGWKNYMYFLGGSQPAFHFLNRCSGFEVRGINLDHKTSKPLSAWCCGTHCRDLVRSNSKIVQQSRNFSSFHSHEILGFHRNSWNGEKKNKANFKKSTGHSGSLRSIAIFETHPTWATDRTAWRSKAMGPGKFHVGNPPEARTKENGVPHGPCVPQPLPILFPYRFQEFEALGLYENGMAGGHGGSY